MSVKKQFNNFQEMISAAELPVLVDFYATWCGPCQMMATILEQVNAQMKNQIRVIKIDTEKYPQLTSDFNVQALPTLILFKQGQIIDRIEGVLPTPELIQRIQAAIA